MEMIVQKVSANQTPLMVNQTPLMVTELVVSAINNTFKTGDSM